MAERISASLKYALHSHSNGLDHVRWICRQSVFFDFDIADFRMHNTYKFSSSPSSSDSDASDCSYSTTDSRVCRRRRALDAIRRRDFVRRLAARRVANARQVLRARFFLNNDLRYAHLVEAEHVQLRSVNDSLQNKIRDMEESMVAMRSFLERRRAARCEQQRIQNSS